jgi:hypothetical protein
MQPGNEASRSPPAPYIIDGKSYYNLRQAAQIIGAVSYDTLRAWAAHGATTFGFELDVHREPMTHHRRSTQTPRSFLQERILIPTQKVYALKEILQDCPRRPGPINREDMEALKAAGRRSRSPLSHLENSPTPE